ncbi:MAG: hypothetical protein H7Y86_04235 [Rhizobacter sp.]|nr:hypothetical protein [Ferruginibacter sp.]
MSYETMVILSYSILPAAVAVVFKLRMIEQIYYPFVVCILTGFINELISTYLISNGYSNATNNNVYSIIEALLILYLFRQWGLFQLHTNIFYVISIVLIATWTYEHRSIDKLGLFLPHFKLMASICIVAMSIITMNKMIIEHNFSLLKAPEFLCCTGFCLYFSTRILMEIFFYYGIDGNIGLQDAVFKSASIINAVTNFLYLNAILWMPRKPKFIMQ